MKKKLICAATVGAFAPASLMAQALAPNQGPMALVYYEVPLGQQSKEAQAAFGLRVLAGRSSGDQLAPPRGSLTPPLADFRFNPKGFESFSLRNSVVFRQAEAGKPADAPVNWWIVGGVIVGAAVVIHNENKKDKQTTTTTTPPACFTAETRVVMADGSTKPISAIVVGDEVQSYDFESGRIAVSRVSHLHSFDTNEYLRVNGLQVTGKHPFAVGHNVWAEASNLNARDLLVGRELSESYRQMLCTAG